MSPSAALRLRPVVVFATLACVALLVALAAVFIPVAAADAPHVSADPVAAVTSHVGRP